MDDNSTRETLKDNFPSNSKTTRIVSKVENKPVERKIEKVISGVARQQKRGWKKKLAETFLEDDTKNVGSYIFHDVLIPAAKSLVCDIVGWGGFAEMLLFREKRGGRTYRDGNKSRINYGSLSRADRDRDRDRVGSRDISRTSRAKHDFDDIILDSRGEAEEVLSCLVDLTIDYGQARVTDLYDMVGITAQYTDDNYGWKSLGDAEVRRNRTGGYLIDLPRAQPLD